MKKINQLVIIILCLFTIPTLGQNELDRYIKRLMENFIRKSRYGDGSIPILDPYFLPLKEPIIQQKKTEK